MITISNEYHSLQEMRARVVLGSRRAQAMRKTVHELSLDPITKQRLINIILVKTK
jgi:hypothetical protein